MKRQTTNYPNAVRVFHYLQGKPLEGMPLVNIVYDEGYDELQRMRFGLIDHRAPPKFKVKIRWKGNSNLSNWDVIYQGGNTLLSGKVRRIMEEFDQSAAFYPVQMLDRWGGPVDGDFYYIIVHSTPGGEVPTTSLRQQSAKHPRFFLSDKEVGNAQVFRAVYSAGASPLISHEIFERLIGAKCKGLDTDAWVGTKNIDWDPHADVAAYLESQFVSKGLLDKFVLRNRSWVKKYMPEWLHCDLQDGKN